MKKIVTITFVLLLVSCASTTQQQPQHSESISRMDYQNCIQAAMSGNGQSSEVECEKVRQDAR